MWASPAAGPGQNTGPAPPGPAAPRSAREESQDQLLHMLALASYFEGKHWCFCKLLSIYYK